MMLRKFYGSTIQEARKNARDVLGSSFIVVETKEALDGERAWIHVMDDGKENASTKDERNYLPGKLLPKAFSKIKETMNESLQMFNDKDSNESAPAPKESVTSSNYNRRAARGYAQSQILSRPEHVPEFSIDNHTQPKADLTRDMQKLSKRFDRLEELMGNNMMGLNIQTVSHPAFQQLLTSGVPHPIISQWFNELMSEGIDPYNQQGNFTYLLAQKVKQSLDVAAHSAPAKFMIFTGSAGSGKSSLIMKLALHSSLLGDTSRALVTICNQESNPCFSPLSAFAYEQEIPHYKIEGPEQLQEFQKKRHTFDHILIEMPQGSGVISMNDITQLVSKGESSEVHRVLNVALNQAYLNRYCTTSNHHKTDYLAFTHLDQVPQKGHLLPIMHQPDCKVRYTTHGSQIPGDVSTFKPEQFARQLLTT